MNGVDWCERSCVRSRHLGISASTYTGTGNVGPGPQLEYRVVSTTTSSLKTLDSVNAPGRPVVSCNTSTLSSFIVLNDLRVVFPCPSRCWPSLALAGAWQCQWPQAAIGVMDLTYRPLGCRQLKSLQSKESGLFQFSPNYCSLHYIFLCGSSFLRRRGGRQGERRERVWISQLSWVDALTQSFSSCLSHHIDYGRNYF